MILSIFEILFIFKSLFGLYEKLNINDNKKYEYLLPYLSLEKNILTNDNYYNGFPAIWNVIVLYFYIFGTSQNFNLVFLILLILLKFSPLKCIHPLRVKKFKSLSIIFAIFWFITSILLILIKDLNINPVYEVFLMFLWVVSNIYFISVSIFKTLKN